MVIDILPILLLLIFIFKLKIVRPLAIVNDDYLSITTSRVYKGLLALVVVFHHLAQRTKNGVLFHPFSGVGYLAVSVFFFFSGYGLQKSYMKSEDYKRRFLLYRLPKVLIPYIIVTFLYWIMNFIMGDIYTIKEIIITAIIEGLPIDSNSWYIISIIAFYSVFWVLMLLFQKHYFLMILGACLWYILYVIYCLKMGYGEYWFNASHLLIVGMFWAIYEKKILDIIEGHYFFITVTIWLFFCFLICMSNKIFLLIPIKGIGFICTVLKAILFTVGVLLFSLKFKVSNQILDFLGKISFEIYMLHGLFITILRSNIIYIYNELLWCVLVLLCTIPFAFMMHIVFNSILKIYKKFIEY